MMHWQRCTARLGSARLSSTGVEETGMSYWLDYPYCLMIVDGNLHVCSITDSKLAYTSLAHRSIVLSHN